MANALRGCANRVYGENGALKEEKTDYPHVQGMSDSVRSGNSAPTFDELRNARDWMDKMVDYAVRNKDPIALRDAFISVFVKRHRDEGEGEKAIGLEWFMRIHDHFPQTAKDLIAADVLGLYGCYQDYNRLLKMISDRQSPRKELTPGATVRTTSRSEATKIQGLYDLAISIRSTMLDVRTRDLKALDKYLKDCSCLESAGHWSRKGVRGFESLPGGDPRTPSDPSARVAVLRAFLDKTMVKEVDDEDTTVYPYLDKVSAHLKRKVLPINISLAGKWVGSEGLSWAKKIRILTPYPAAATESRYMADPYLNFMIRGGMSVKGAGGPLPFPVDRPIPSGAKSQWRKRNASLRTALDIPEVKMCRGEYDKLNWERVFARCLKICGKAFLNELRKKAPAPSEEETGNRHPHDARRVAARQSLRQFFHGDGAHKLNASGLLPHELAHKALSTKSTAESDLNNALWEAMKTNTKEKLQAAREQMVADIEQGKFTMDEKKASILKAMRSGNFLPMSDTSGSMTWGDHGGYSSGQAPNRPYDVSVGLGAFMAQCSNDAWEGLCLSFADEPVIFDVKGLKASEAYRKITTGSRGYSTDLMKAMTRVLDFMCEHNVPEGEEPVLVVFTDGEFNDTNLNRNSSGWETTYEKIVKAYVRRGRKRVPMIVWWNLKSERMGVQTKDNCPGVLHLQSKNPALFKFILFGEAMPDTEKKVIVDGKATTVKTSSVTPYLGFRKMVDQAMWSPVDEVLVRSKEGLLSEYHGMPVEDE